MNSLSEKALRRLVEALAKGRLLVGPTAENSPTSPAANAPLQYRPTTAQALVLDDRLPESAPKAFLFPQNEKVYTLRGEKAIACLPKDALLLVGAKPCDLAGLEVLRAVLLRPPAADPLFARRLARSLFIGLDCAEKKPGCFCDELGLRRDTSAACDLFFRRENGGFTLTHASAKGLQALALLPETAPLTPAPPPGPPRGENHLSLAAAPSAQALFSAIDWPRTTERCLGCKLCTYLCPTCHCFAFRDAPEHDGMARYRCWDSCLSPRFTLHASGHNPRALRHEQYRQRVLHKYYYIEQNVGLPACTGCGRCVRKCPAGMDIAQVVRALREVL